MTESPAPKSPSEDIETPDNPVPPMVVEALAPPYRVVIYVPYKELREKFDDFWDEFGERLIAKFKIKARKQKGGGQPQARKMLEKKLRPSKLYGNILSKIIREKLTDDIMFVEGLELFNYPPPENEHPQIVSIVYFVPELEMRGTINWAVKRPPLPPEEDEWERRLKEVQRQHRSMEPDEGSVVTEKHKVLLDVTASVDGEPYIAGTFQGQWLEVDVIHIPELKESLLRHERGDLFEVEFEAKHDKKINGKMVQASVKVHDLQIIHTPEIDDELAKDAGFEDLEDFRKRFHQDYGKYVKNAEKSTAVDHVINQIMLNSRIPPFPQEWINQNVDRIMEIHLQNFKGDRKRAMAAVAVDNEEDFRQKFVGQLYRDYMQQLAMRYYCKLYEIEKEGSDEMFDSILSQVRWINEEETVEGSRS